MAFRIAFAWLAIGFVSSGTTTAQQPPPHAPQIQAVLISADELVADLKFLTELSGSDGVKAWKPLKETLDTFLGGIDPSKPIIAEVLMSKSGSENRLHFPLKDPPGKPAGQAFLANLKGFGIEAKRLAPGLYELKKAYEGYLRLLNNYGTIAEKRDSVPANLPDPLKLAAALIAKKYDVALQVKNDKITEADQKARRGDFQKTKENLLAGLKVGPDERPEDFELRKMMSQFVLDELERFLSDSTDLFLGWNTDAKQVKGMLDLDMSLIKGSSLDKAAEAFGKDPGLFASVPRDPNAVVSGRTNFPLDEQRQTHAKKFFELSKASAEKTIEADTGRSADQKTAFKKASALWFDLLVDATKIGALDAMIEVSQVSGEKANLVFGVKSPNAEKSKDVLEMIPKFKAGGQVKLDVEKVGDVSIHHVTWPDEDGEFVELFGKGAPAIVGTSPTALWVAVGANSEAQLKAAIAASGKKEGVDATNFVTLFAKAAPLIDILNARRNRLDAKAPPKKLTDAEAKNKKDREAYRKLAIESFKGGKDTWETKINAKDNKITGQTRVDEGLLRYIGAAISKFSNETLK